MVLYNLWFVCIKCLFFVCSIPENFQKPFCEVLFHDRLNVRLHEELFFPAVTSFRWRVDVAISTTALNRVLEPSIIMSVKTSEDEEHLFEVRKIQA